MSRRIPVLVVAAATTLSLAACGSDSSGSRSSEATVSSPTAPPSTSSSAVATSSVASSAPAAAASPVAVNKTITDPELGNKFQVLRYIDGYQASAAAKQRYSTVKDGKVVLVEVKVTAGTKYSGGVDDGDFRLTKTSNDIDAVTTSILDDEVAKAGYAPLERARSGMTTTGWIVFVVDKELSTLVLRVKRLAYKIIDGGNIPAKTWDLPLN